MRGLTDERLLNASQLRRNAYLCFNPMVCPARTEYMTQGQLLSAPALQLLHPLVKPRLRVAWRGPVGKFDMLWTLVARSLE